MLALPSPKSLKSLNMSLGDATVMLAKIGGLFFYSLLYYSLKVCYSGRGWYVL